MKTTALALLLVPVTALAASPFDGTWKVRTDSLKVTGKADAWTLQDGTFSCSSCDPPLNVKADGSEHKVTGHDYYDAISIKALDKNTVEQTRKRAGKVSSTVTMTVSADGKTLNGKFTDYNGEKPATGSFIEKRVAAGPPGSHAISGEWLQSSMSDANDALSIVSYKLTDDGFNMNANGQSYQAKFDGKEYPVSGDPGKTQVTVKKLDANTIEETDRRDGKITDEIHLAAGKDGRTIALTDKDMVHHQTITMTLEKQ